MKIAPFNILRSQIFDEQVVLCVESPQKRRSHRYRELNEWIGNDDNDGVGGVGSVDDTSSAACKSQLQNVNKSI